MKPGLAKRHQVPGEACSGDYVRLAEDLAGRVNMMRTLLFLCKINPPMGSTAAAILNLFLSQTPDQVGEKPALRNIDFNALAEATDQGGKELKDALDCLQQQGIISYRLCKDGKTK